MALTLGLSTVLAALLAFLLMAVVLLQEPKGGGLAAALGAGGTIGHDVGRVNRFTAAVGAAWLVCCLVHAYVMPFTS